MTGTPSVPGAITIASGFLTGNELVAIATAGPQSAQTTTAAIAALAADSTNQIINTPITTVGNGTLTGAALVGGLITRTGPVAAFSDATDSAANIVAALPGGVFLSGAQFTVTIKNATAYLQTITAGASVTLPGTFIIGPFQEGQYYGTVGGTAASPTVTLGHLNTVPIAENQTINAPQIAALNTVSNGILLIAAMTSGLVSRGGSQSGTPFTDTTDSAANIIAGSLALVGKVGGSFLFEYANTTNAVVTITNGATVTMAGVVTVPPSTIAQFLVQSTSATAVTITGLGITQNISTGVTIAGLTSGYVEIVTPATAGAVTLTTPPIASSGTIAATSGTDLYIADIYRSASSTSLANATPGAINGMGAIPIVVGTYRIKASLPNTSNGTSGIQITFTLTTAVLGAINTTAKNFEAAAIQTQYNATATSGTALFASTTASVEISIDGTFTVTTAGTIALNAALNTGTTSAVIQAGAYAEFIRIA